MSENEKREIPNLLSKKIDIRALTISTFFDAIDILKSGTLEEVSLGKDTKVICFTSFGTVTGTILPQSDTDNQQHKNVALFHNVIMNVRNSHVDQFETEGVEQVINHSGYIPLVDVEITYYATPNRTDRLAYFLLFPEQVVGLTFGEHQEN